MKKIIKSILLLSVTLACWSCSDDDEVVTVNESISLSTNIIQMDQQGGTAMVTVNSSGDWRLAGMCHWIHPSATSGKDGDVVTFTIDENRKDEVRMATLKFFTGAAVVSLQVEMQHGYELDLLSEKQVSLSKDANSFKVEVNTNIAELNPKLTEGTEDWLVLDRSVEFAGKTTYFFSVMENRGYKKRSSVITFSSSLVEESIEVEVDQNQTNAIVVEKEAYILGLDAQTVVVKLGYNVDYHVTVTEGNDWLTNQQVSVGELGDDGLTWITLTYDMTVALNIRGAAISIGNNEERITKEISVVQAPEGTVLASVPDKALHNYLCNNGWSIHVGGSQCIVTEKGKTETKFNYYDYANQIKDLRGIENFPAIESLKIGFCNDMKEFDISKLHNVKEITFTSSYNCGYYNLGDNPIECFDMGGSSGSNNYLEVPVLTIIGSKIEELILDLAYYRKDLDCVVTIDVSQCPKLDFITAIRSNLLRTLYLKKGIEPSIVNVDKNVTEVVYK